MLARAAFTAAVLVGLVSSSALAGVIIDRIVATVNGEAITLYELYKAELPLFGTSLLPGRAEVRSPEEVAKERELLEKLVEERLLAREARERGFRIAPEEIDQALENVKSDGKLTDDMFLKALTQRGLTLEDFRRKIANDLLIARLYNTEIRTKVVVTKEEVSAFYQDHLDEFTTPERVMIRHLVIRRGATPAEDEEARRRAETARGLIDGGRDFREVAQLYSQEASAVKGDVSGYLKRGDMLPELEEIVFGLAPDQLSPVVTTTLGHHVVMLAVKEPPRTQTIEESRAQIENRLLQEKTNRRAREFIDGMRRGAAIEIKL